MNTFQQQYDERRITKMGKNRNFYQNNEEVTNEAEAPVVEDKKPELKPEPEVKKVEPVVTNTTNKKPEIKNVQKKGTATL